MVTLTKQMLANIISLLRENTLLVVKGLTGNIFEHSLMKWHKNKINKMS